MHKAIRQYLKQIGRKGGSVISREKATAARKNGKLGGRPVGSKDSRPRKRRKS